MLHDMMGMSKILISVGECMIECFNLMPVHMGVVLMLKRTSNSLMCIMMLEQAPSSSHFARANMDGCVAYKVESMCRLFDVGIAQDFIWVAWWPKMMREISTYHPDSYPTHPLGFDRM